MLLSVTKAKHGLTGIVERTSFCFRSQINAVNKNNWLQKLFSSSLPDHSSEQNENVVYLDPDEVKEGARKTKSYGPPKRLSDWEEKFFGNHKKEGRGSSENDSKNLYKCIEGNESFFRKCVLKLNSKRQRKREDKVLVDNVKIIRDAIALGFHPEMIFYTRASVLDSLNLNPNTKCLRISYKQMELWSDTVSSQGVVALFVKPSNTLKIEENYSSSIPLTIICDDIRDPTNMGSLLRVAASVGCRKLILTKGCVDIWNPKVIRSAAGAHFQFPYLYNMEWDAIENEISDECKVFLAESTKLSYEETENLTGEIQKTSRNSLSDSLPLEKYYSVSYAQKDVAIVVGNESRGLSDSAYSLAHKKNGSKIFIPMFNAMHSLNISVALGILAYEVRKQIETHKNLMTN